MKLPDSVKQAVIDFIRRRQSWYRDTFLNPVGDKVLRDLANFCRANGSTFHSDPRVHAALEGRREVWLRIQQHLQLTDEQLWALYGKNPD